MNRGVAVGILAVLALAGIAAYFLLPARLPIPVETREGLLQSCVDEGARLGAYAQAVRSADAEQCDSLDRQYAAFCRAKITGNAGPCQNLEPDLKPTCDALAAASSTSCPAGDAFCRALSGSRADCANLGLLRFSCENMLDQDLSYAGSEKARQDCANSVMLEAVLESRDARNCELVENTVLRNDCARTLAR